MREAIAALVAVEAAMLRREDGSIGSAGWNITALNKARPAIHQALANASCPASPDHADILETIENAAPDWQAKGYVSALAEVRDMANVGRALMEALPSGYHYNDCPSEIVSDLQNKIAENQTRAQEMLQALAGAAIILQMVPREISAKSLITGGVFTAGNAIDKIEATIMAYRHEILSDG